MSKFLDFKSWINEKFVEDSDPVADMGIGIRAQISRWMEEKNQEDTDNNALAECAEHGKLDWVKFLIAAGANVHAKYEGSFAPTTALETAKRKDHQDIVDFLEDYIAKEKKKL
jgi:hypothetical protein